VASSIACPIPPDGLPTLDDVLGHIRVVAFKEARRRGMSPEDAADAAQEISIRAWTHFAAGKTIASYNAWTRRATSNYVIDQHRKRSSAKRGENVTETLADLDESRICWE